MAARKPAIDEVARRGRTGTLVTIPGDMPTGSDVANLSVMGYDPHECFQGRGVIEAASMGVKLGDDDVAMRCNLICVEGGRVKNHSAGHIGTEEAAKIIRWIDAELGGERVRFHPGVSYRHLLVLKGASPLLECFPPHDHVGKPIEEIMPRSLSEEARETADLVNSLIRRSREILPSHPVNAARRAAGKDEANSLWPWSPGKRPKMRTLKELFGLSGAVISAVDLIKGLGVYAGMDVIEVEGATGLYDTNYEGKARAALDAIGTRDLVYVHVEATDEAGHGRDLDLKIRCIEYLDSRLVRPILDGLRSRGIEAAVAILPDHPTPVERGDHVRDPVPVAVMDPRFPPDAVERFDEQSVLEGGLGLMRGREFMERLVRGVA